MNGYREVEGTLIAVSLWLCYHGSDLVSEGLENLKIQIYRILNFWTLLPL